MKRVLASVLLCAACGKDLHHGVDAAPADASTDTISPSADNVPANAVKLTITRIGAPVVGVAVLFQGPDGLLVHSGLTNDKGLAWAIMDSGGFVTAIESKGLGVDELTTFSEVKPAESLQLAFEPTGDIGEWPVVLSIPSDPGAAGYQVFTSCGGPFGGDPAQPGETQLVGCKGVADVAVVTEDADGQPLRAFYTANLTVPDPPPPPDTDAMPPVYPPFAVTGFYSSLMTKTFSYTNVPSFVSFVGTYHAFANGHGRVYERNVGDAPAAGAVTTVMALPNATPMSLVGTTLMTHDVGEQIIFESGAGGASYALDVGGALVPPFATPPTFDIANRTVSWTERSGPSAPDLVRTRVHFYRDDIPMGRAWSWRMIAPRSGTSVTYPRLPVYSFDFNPQSGDIVGVDELTTASVPGGYAAARPIGFSDLQSLVVGTTSRLVVQILHAEEL